MATGTDNYEVWRPEVYAFIDEGMENALRKAEYESLFTIKETDRLNAPEIPFAGYRPMQEVGEFGNAVAQDPLQGFRTDYNRKDFRMETTFSAASIQTDQHNVLENLGKSLPETVMYSRNLNILSVIRRAYDLTTTYATGKTAASTAIPLKDGSGTYSTTFFDGVQRAPNYANAVALRKVLISQVADNGNLLNIGASDRKQVLWGSSALEQELFEIAGVEAKDRPDTANRAMNFFVKGAYFDVLIFKGVTFEAAKQMGEIGTATKLSNNIWDGMWGICDVETMKKYWKVYVQSGYKGGKFDDEINKRNESMTFYGYDAYTYGVTSFLGFTVSNSSGATWSN